MVSFTGIIAEGRGAGTSVTMMFSVTGIIAEGKTPGESVTVIFSITGIIAEGNGVEASVTLIVSLTSITAGPRFTVVVTFAMLLDGLRSVSLAKTLMVAVNGPAV